MNTIYNTYKASEEAGIDEKFYEDFGNYWSKESANCEQKYLTPDTRGIIKDFIKSFIKSFNRTSALALLESVREMISEVKEKKEQVNGFQPYGIDNFLNDDGESIFFDGFDDGRNLMKIDLLNLIKSVEQAQQLIKQ